MAAKKPAKEAIVKLIVGAGQASPSPPVGPALGSKGVKSMDFCKEFNALTSNMLPGTPIPALITVRPDRSFHFTLRTPPTSVLLLLAAGVEPTKNSKVRGANAPGRVPVPSAGDTSPTHVQARGSKNLAKSAGGGVGLGVVKEVSKVAGGDRAAGHGGGSTQVGTVSLKHVYEIAKIKQSEARLSGLSLQGLCRSVIAQARSIGVGVVP